MAIYLSTDGSDDLFRLEKKYFHLSTSFNTYVSMNKTIRSDSTAVDLEAEWRRAQGRALVLGIHLPDYDERGALFRLRDGAVAAYRPLALASVHRKIARLQQLLRELDVIAADGELDRQKADSPDGRRPRRGVEGLLRHSERVQGS